MTGPANTNLKNPVTDGMIDTHLTELGEVTSRSLAREAASLERLHLWSAASGYWAASTRMATGINLDWYQARLDWCQRRGGEAFAGDIVRKGGILPPARGGRHD